MRLAAIFGVGILLATGALRAATVTIAESVTVSGAQVLLRDVAVIEATAAETTALCDVVLTSAPSLGQQKELTLGMIRMRLRQYYLNPDTITFHGATTVHIQRALPPATAETPTALAVRWLRSQLPAPATGEEVSITPLPDFTATTPPADGVTWACADAGGNVPGVRAVRVMAMSAGTCAWQTVVRVQMQRALPALVVRRALPHGVQVTAADVAVERCEVPEGAEIPLRDLLAFSGYHTTATLTVGHPLYAHDLAPPTVVKARDRVKVTARCGTLTLNLIATACEDGAVGQLIHLRNAQSNREIQARVTAPDAAEIVQ